MRNPRWCAILFLGAAVVRLKAAEVMPPKPDHYFNDYAGVVSQEAARRFDEQLMQFERDTSNQVVVAVFHKMETDSDIADYTQRIAQSWKVGQGDKRNGAVLFVFVDDRKMFIQVGYGLEGALPDLTAYDITERHIKPSFRTGDYEGGLATGIDLMLKAIRGEYKGTGRTHGETESHPSGFPVGAIIFFIIVAMIIASRFNRLVRRGYGYSGFGGPFIGGFGGGGWSGGGGGGFSGFSGGGGSFGGGGAGSSW